MLLATALIALRSGAVQAQTYDLVLAKGRVIVAISSTPVAGRQVVDVQGLVVAPGGRYQRICAASDEACQSLEGSPQE